jgi:hypothetical protein
MFDTSRPKHAALALLVTALAAACSSEEQGATSDTGVRPSDAATSPPQDEAGAVATSDAGSDGGASGDAGDAGTDPCVGRKVCDGFEGATAGGAPAAPWKVEVNGAGTVSVSTTRAFRGTNSVKITTPTAAYQKAYLVTNGAPLFPAAAGALYGRMMVWLEGDTQAAGNNVHWTLIQASGPVPSETNVNAFYRWGGQSQAGNPPNDIMANYDTTGKATDCWDHSKTRTPLDKWACWSWKFAGANNELQLAIDGVDVADAHVVNKGEGCLGNGLAGVWAAPTFTKASLGWESYQQDPGHTMYLDDVILDDKPVACP